MESNEQEYGEKYNWLEWKPIKSGYFTVVFRAALLFSHSQCIRCSIDARMVATN